MNIEVMIFVYMAVCTAMIMFNCVMVLVNSRQKKQMEQVDRRLTPRIFAQLDRLERGETVEESHVEWMGKKLRRLGNMRAFDTDMEEMQKTRPEATEKYLDAVCLVFSETADRYCGRDTLKAAYFAYVVHKYHIARRIGIGSLTETILGLLHSPSVYARENALHIIYDMGDAGYVIQALKILDESRIFHHSKLIHDGLLEFTGNRDELVSGIWEEFSHFSHEMQTTLVNYMRLSGGGFSENVFDLMMAPKQDDEVYFACMRYFGRYPYEPAYPVLLDDLRKGEGRRWELAAVAATALRSYPKAETVEALKEALHSSTWYVRANAAESLEALGISYADLAAVFEGNDRYAREILQYRLDYRRAKEKEGAVI